MRFEANDRHAIRGGARRHRVLESSRQTTALLGRRAKTRPAGLNMRAGARGELAAGRLAAAECTAHFGEVDTEHVVQEEACTLERGQAFERQDQRNGNIVREFAGRFVIEGLVDHRLGQPLTDIKLAPRVCRFHPVEAQPRHHGSEIAARLLDCGTIGGVPAQIRVLHHAPEADDLREEVVRLWGKRGLISLAFAMVSARIFPTLKYALGHGRACMRVTVGGEPQPVLRQMTRAA